MVCLRGPLLGEGEGARRLELPVGANYSLKGESFWAVTRVSSGRGCSLVRPRGGIHLLGRFRARRISRPASAAFGIERVCGLTVFGCGPLFGVSRGC